MDYKNKSRKKKCWEKKFDHHESWFTINRKTIISINLTFHWLIKLMINVLKKKILSTSGSFFWKIILKCLRQPELNREQHRAEIKRGTCGNLIRIGIWEFFYWFIVSYMSCIKFSRKFDVPSLLFVWCFERNPRKYFVNEIDSSKNC